MDLKPAYHDPRLHNHDLPPYIPNPAYQVTRSPPHSPTSLATGTVRTPQQVLSYEDHIGSFTPSDVRCRSQSQPPEQTFLPEGGKFSPQRPYLQDAEFMYPQFPSHYRYPDRSVRNLSSPSLLPRSPRELQLSPVSPADGRLPKGSQHGYDGPYHSFQTDDDDDVFGPGPPRAQTGLASLPRHSSLKPSQQQTYLTGERDVPGFTLEDISSVLDNPEQNSRHQRPSWQRTPRESTSLGPHSKLGGPSQDERSPQHEKPLAQVWPSPKSADDSASNNSNGQPLGYTRDQLHNVVDRLRQTFRPQHIGPDQYLDVTAQGTHSKAGQHRNRPEYRGPGGSALGRPSAGHDPIACVGPPKPARLYPVGLGVRYPEDGQSSGIGSRNTSQSTNSLQRPRPKPSAASSSSLFTPQESFLDDDSSHPNLDRSSLRRDTSADENYEFDSLPAVESDLLDDLKRYSQLSTAGGKALGPREGDLMGALYPKPRHQSQYADAAERFERLREEFLQYRRQQSTSQSSLYHEAQPMYPMDSEML